jgi:hypothetical protein
LKGVEESSKESRKRMLYVVKGDSPKELCKKIRQKQFDVKMDVTDKADFMQAGDLKSQLQFDLNNKYLVGYGGLDFFTLDL